MVAVAKRSIEVELDEALLRRAEAAGVDIVEVMENAVRRALDGSGSIEAERWRSQNAAAIEALNRYAEEHGVPLSRYRRYPWPDTSTT